MGQFRYVPQDGTAKRRREESATLSRPTRPERQPTRRNVEPVLSLGSMRYFLFGSRQYRIPPVPYLAGERVLELHIKILADAKQVALTGDAKAMRAFYVKHGRMAKLLWKHIQPLGKVQRFFWRLGLARNPFRQASEKELTEVVDFFLQGRMKSSVRSMSEAEIQNPA